MKQTRKIFCLDCYDPPDEQIIRDTLQFKGLTTFFRKNISLEDLVDVFKHNKSALCISSSLPGNFSKKAIMVDNLNVNADLISQFKSIVEKNNCDIGDHNSNRSGLTGAPTIADCTYCRTIKGISKEVSKILYASENFYVKATLGEFINGYLLIIPYSHIMSNAELSFTLRQEFLEVLEDVTYILQLTYGTPNVLVWENGSGNSGVGKAKDSIVHSHTHIAPSNMTYATIENESGFPFKKISYDQLSDYKTASYLLINNFTSSSYFSLNWNICQESGLYIPRQYIRQLLAEEYNLPGESWNWRTHHFEEKIIETDNQIIKTLKRYWAMLPQRIRDRTKDYILF